MVHAGKENKSVTLNVSKELDIYDIMNWEFNSYHTKTFSYTIESGVETNTVKACGLEFLTNWLEYLINYETSKLTKSTKQLVGV